MRKSHLLRTTVRGYRPSIRLGKHGHPMRDPDGHQDGSSQSSSDDNNTGNSGQSSGDSQQQNNRGQEFDLSKFWESPEGKSGEAPSGESAAKPDSSSGHQQQQQQDQTPAQRLMSDIQGLDFKSFGMNDTVIAELAEGKTDAFNANLNQMGQTAVQHAVRLMVPLMGQMREQMRQEFEGKISGNDQNRDNTAALTEAFSGYKDPKAKPLIDSTFNQAMKHTNNDRNKAIALTRDMLRVSAEAMGNDIGIPPKTSGDNFGGRTGTTNWLEELTSR